MKRIFIILGILLGAGTGALFAGVVRANPSEFATSSSSATATSSVVYMTFGTATTTVYYDAYEDASGYKADSALLAIQFTGSSTASILNIAFEYTYGNSLANCKTTPTACDWYRDNLLGTNAVVSTSTNTIVLASTNSYSLPFSSTTLGGATGISPITTRVMTVPTPTRYVRAVITIPPQALSGAVWASFRPDKEIPE